jgi:hypothetical protein
MTGNAGKVNSPPGAKKRTQSSVFESQAVETKQSIDSTSEHNVRFSARAPEQRIAETRSASPATTMDEPSGSYEMRGTMRN